jgi:ligand-binding sensor domain-containing protein/signal transduction histidine kinase
MRAKRIRLARGAAGLFLCLSSLLAEQLPARRYTTADGLPGNSINSIVLDSRGYLWFVTFDGLACFDGYRFRDFGAADGLPHPQSELIETAGSDYWLATTRGLAHFRPTSPNPRFEIYAPPESANPRVLALAADGSGGLWLSTETGLYRMERTSGAWRMRFVQLGISRNFWGDKPITAVVPEADGQLWLATRGGLYQCHPGGGCQAPPLPSPLRDVLKLLKDSAGTLWVGTMRGVCRIPAGLESGPGGPQRTCSAIPEFHDEAIEDLVESAEGEVLIASQRGVGSCRVTRTPAAPGPCSAENRLPGYRGVRALAFDRFGNLWAGVNGAVRIAKHGFRTYTSQDGLRSNHILSFLETREGELCVVTEGNTERPVNCLDGHRFHAARPNVPRDIRDWGWSTRQLTFQARNGEWWVPTGNGLFRFPSVAAGKLDQILPRGEYARGESIYEIFQDSRGGVWVSTQILASQGVARANSLSRWDPARGGMRRYPDGEPVPKESLATAFAEDQQGNVWIGLNSGQLCRYRDGRLESFSPGNQKLTWINSLFVDHADRLWVGTGDGLYRIDRPNSARPEVSRYGIADGLSTNRISCIAEDLQGRIYLGSALGIDRLEVSALPRVRHYTARDGLAAGDVLVAFRDRHGTLWFGTREGLARLDPDATETFQPTPVFISGLRVRGAPRPVAFLGETSMTGLRLSPDQNQVELEFTGLDFGSAGALRYQYRLLHTEREWGPPTVERRVNYANLAPGSYRWEVRAITEEGNAGTAATAEFTILPPLWQRWWMRLLMLAGIAGLIYGVSHYRLERLLEMERLRTRIATDLHDDIGSSLSQIALLSEVARRMPTAEKRDKPLADIARLSGDLVDSMSDIVWAIDPDQDHLDHMTNRMRRFASDLFSRDGVELRLDLPAEEHDTKLGTDIRRQVFLIFKESLHNAVRHSGCTQVDVQLSLEGGMVTLRVADNGRGFDDRKPVRGHGLASMRARAALLQGELAVESSPGRGTTVSLKVPLTTRPAKIRI